MSIPARPKSPLAAGSVEIVYQGEAGITCRICFTDADGNKWSSVYPKHLGRLRFDPPPAPPGPPKTVQEAMERGILGIDGDGTLYYFDPRHNQRGNFSTWDWAELTPRQQAEATEWWAAGGEQKCLKMMPVALEGGQMPTIAPKKLQDLTWKYLRSSPDDLRKAGLMVAVHNDYRFEGVPYTFWLMTIREDEQTFAFKGEGTTDEEALDNIRRAWAKHSDKLHHAPMCPANHYEGMRAPTGQCNCGALEE